MPARTIELARQAWGRRVAVHRLLSGTLQRASLLRARKLTQEFLYVCEFHEVYNSVEEFVDAGWRID